MGISKEVAEIGEGSRQREISIWGATDVGVYVVL
jgi:hypothetical protein